MGSRALNYNNLTIPESVATKKGSDNKNYIINAKNFNEYMHKKFRDPTFEIHGQSATNLNNVADFLKGKTGIYTIVKSNTSYSGHVYMIINGKCISGTYIKPPGGIEKIEIWELK